MLSTYSRVGLLPQTQSTHLEVSFIHSIAALAFSTDIKYSFICNHGPSLRKAMSHMCYFCCCYLFVGIRSSYVAGASLILTMQPSLITKLQPSLTKRRKYPFLWLWSRVSSQDTWFFTQMSSYLRVRKKVPIYSSLPGTEVNHPRASPCVLRWVYGEGLGIE